MKARERLHCQMNALMSLQIVVAVEGLRACIALEWPVLLRWRLAVTIHAMVRPNVLAIAMGHRWHATHKSHLPARITHIAHNWAQGGLELAISIRARHIGRLSTHR